MAFVLLAQACAALDPTDASIDEVQRRVSAVEGVAEVEVSGFNDIIFHTILYVEVTLEPDAPTSSFLAVSAALADIDDDSRWIERAEITQVVQDTWTTVDTFDEHPEQVAVLRDGLAAVLPGGSVSLSGTTLHTTDGSGDRVSLPAATAAIIAEDADPAEVLERSLDLAQKHGLRYEHLTITTSEGADPIDLGEGAQSHPVFPGRWIDRNGAECLAAIRAMGVRPTGVHMDDERAFVWVTEADLPRATQALTAITDPDVVLLVTGTPMSGDPATEPTAVPSAGQAGP